MSVSTAHRIYRVRARLEELGLDALLVTTPSNRRWVCASSSRTCLS